MKIFRNTFDYDISRLDYLSFDIYDCLFFDIETTGFSAPHTKLYLIGCLYYDSSISGFRTIQWFMDDINDEPKLLEAFFDFTNRFKYLIHFNGDGFDIPYLKHKCDSYLIKDTFSKLTSIDLYKAATKLKNVIKLENMKQKTIEKFLGLNREDKYSGGELIKIFENYLKSYDEASLNLLILHNLDDLKGLPGLTSILSYTSLFNGEFSVRSIALENCQDTLYTPAGLEAIIELDLKAAIPVRISGKADEFYMTAYSNTAKLKIDVYQNELKFFYPNYKDYFYLPEEDRSIHKSVAFYVDKNFRTKAKAANCYSKKTGRFLPQRNEIISPYFKIEYYDKTTYFEVTDDFLTNSDLIKNYAIHVLNIIS